MVEAATLAVEYLASTGPCAVTVLVRFIRLYSKIGGITLNNTYETPKQNAGTTNEMDIRELTGKELEDVTGGWELDQLSHGEQRRWERTKQQLNSDDEDERERAEHLIRSLDKKFTRKYDKQ